MKQTILKRTLVLTILVVSGFATSGCDSSGPEFIGGDTRIIEGTLLIDEASETEFFALVKAGTVNILASRVEGRFPETGEPVAIPSIAVSIGAPDPADATVCQLTFSKSLVEGESFSVFYREGFFCLSVFRLTGSPEETVYDYVLTLTGAFS